MSPNWVNSMSSLTLKDAAPFDTSCPRANPVALTKINATAIPFLFNFNMDLLCLIPQGEWSRGASHGLKGELQCQLERPRATRLIERIKIAAGIVQGRVGMTKLQWAIHKTAIDSPKARVVRDVECFGSELKVKSILQG